MGTLCTSLNHGVCDGPILSSASLYVCMRGCGVWLGLFLSVQQLPVFKGFKFNELYRMLIHVVLSWFLKKESLILQIKFHCHNPMQVSSLYFAFKDFSGGGTFNNIDPWY